MTDHFTPHPETCPASNAGPGSDDQLVDVQGEARAVVQAFVQQRLSAIAELARQHAEQRQQEPEPVTKPTTPKVSTPVETPEQPATAAEEPEPTAPQAPATEAGAEDVDPLERRLAYVARLRSSGNHDLADLAERVLKNDSAWRLIEKNNNTTEGE